MHELAVSDHLRSQEAAMGLAEGAADDATLTRLMNLDPAACPPMALEGFFARNGAMHSDWQPQGLVSFNFW